MGEAPMIPNPEFKGEWSAKRITNPDYAEDKELYLMNKKDLGFVGFDLWQGKSGSKFDNLIIAVDADKYALVKEADIKLDTWKAIKDVMEIKKKAAEPVKEVESTVSADEGDDEAEKAKGEDTED